MLSEELQDIQEDNYLFLYYKLLRKFLGTIVRNVFKNVIKILTIYNKLYAGL